MKNDGGQAFPGVIPNPGDVHDQFFGMSVRDYFATKMPTDEIAEINFKHMSRVAMESLAGCPYPAELTSRATVEETAQNQVDRVKFYCAVSAAIRYLHADAMLAERSKI